MNNISWFIFELSINLLQGLAFAFFICGVLKPRNANKKQVFPFVLCTILIFSSLTIVNYLTYFEGISIFVYSAILFIIALLFYKGTILKKIIMSLIPISAMAVGSIVSTNIVSSVFKTPIEELMTQGSGYRLLTVFISNLIFFSILFFIRLFSIKNQIELETSEWLFMGLVLILSIIIFLFIYKAIFLSDSHALHMYLAISILGITAIVITIYILLIRLSQKHYIDTENRLLRQQQDMREKSTQEMKKQFEILQKTKHDFNNMLSIIQTLNNKGQTTEINDFIEKYNDSQEEVAQLVTTGNDYLDALVNSKIIDAKSQGISTKVVTTSYLNGINTIDLCSLIGNLFDNAIRASAESEEKRISLEIGWDGSSAIIITMKNSINSSVLDKNPDLKSDKKDFKNHGYGTKIIKDISLKYKGMADFYEESKLFCCNIILYPEQPN